MQKLFFRGYKIKDLAIPWLGPIFSLVSLFIVGAIGYRMTEGWDWGDCLWMVLITITTIGFGEVEPLSATGRIVTFLIIGGGLVIVQLTLQKLLGLSESGYFRRMRELKLQRMLRRMRNHVIICGYGRIGKEISQQLQSEEVPILIVELDPAMKNAAEKEGLNVLFADATLDETLLLAGIKSCRSLVVALSNDAANLYVVLSARGLSKDCRLISRAESEEAANKLRLAGATVVVSPYIAAGKAMAATALRPLAVNFMELLAGSQCEIEEFLLTDDVEKFAQIKNRTLSELNVGRQSGAMVLAIRDGDDLITNPGGDFVISPGQLLIALGNKKQLALLRQLIGDILLTVEKINY
ncbi:MULTISPECIES: potassium channel family protein [unclassified Prochlorococcus]|uniref:potassium channel family protein n=1 Tax=unclassified Prochlorococcus TaxID=2627481 RepID=UPI00053394C5|nr:MULTISPECIES: potassium channel protein [unclassified Prochlorococcus]KGG14910.1 putative potassium channel [Prochlorococcus sp. MIT 0602]KGG15657.1 putative potassium channel [Prochlorococcus sp. MIT 0603]